MAYNKKVTKSVFNAVKTLLKGGASVKEVMEYMGLSDYTVYTIRAAETHEEYENILAEKRLAAKQAYAAKKKPQTAPATPSAQQQAPVTQVVEHRQTVMVQATWAMTQEMQKTNELLKLISNKLAFIVDELCGTVKGEG